MLFKKLHITSASITCALLMILLGTSYSEESSSSSSSGSCVSSECKYGCCVSDVCGTESQCNAGTLVLIFVLSAIGVALLVGIILCCAYKIRKGQRNDIMSSEESHPSLADEDEEDVSERTRKKKSSQKKDVENKNNLTQQELLEDHDDGRSSIYSNTNNNNPLVGSKFSQRKNPLQIAANSHRLSSDSVNVQTLRSAKSNIVSQDPTQLVGDSTLFSSQEQDTNPLYTKFMISGLNQKNSNKLENTEEKKKENEYEFDDENKANESNSKRSNESGRNLTHHERENQNSKLEGNGDIELMNLDMEEDSVAQEEPFRDKTDFDSSAQELQKENEQAFKKNSNNNGGNSSNAFDKFIGKELPKSGFENNSGDLYLDRLQLSTTGGPRKKEMFAEPSESNFGLPGDKLPKGNTLNPTFLKNEVNIQEKPKLPSMNYSSKSLSKKSETTSQSNNPYSTFYGKSVLPTIKQPIRFRINPMIHEENYSDSFSKSKRSSSMHDSSRDEKSNIDDNQVSFRDDVGEIRKMEIPRRIKVNQMSIADRIQGSMAKLNAPNNSQNILKINHIPAVHNLQSVVEHGMVKNKSMKNLEHLKKFHTDAQNDYELPGAFDEENQSSQFEFRRLSRQKNSKYKTMNPSKSMQNLESVITYPGIWREDERFSKTTDEIQEATLEIDTP